MDTKSKYLTGAFIVLIIISIFLTYKRSFVDHDYEVISETEETE